MISKEEYDKYTNTYQYDHLLAKNDKIIRKKYK